MTGAGERTGSDGAGSSGDTGGLGRRTIAAANWRLASYAVQGVLQLGVGVLLARRLPPTDFGVMALAAVIIGFATLAGDLGLGPALIQRQPLTSRHLRVAFTVSLLLGAALSLALFATSGIWAQVFDVASLAPVLRLESLLFVLAAAGGPALALLRRQLDFRRLFFIESSSYVLGYALVAVTMAYSGYGVWSLVWGALVQRFLASAMALLVVRHPLSPSLARVELGELLGFGVGVSLNQLVNYFARNGDNVVVGRGLGPHELGLYSRAFNLMALPLGYVDGVMWNVLLPALSRIQHDAKRFRQAYLLSLQVSCLASVPLMAGFAVAAPHLVLGLYGDRWLGSVSPFQALCLAGPFRAVYNVAGAVAHASGRVYDELVRQVGFALLVVVGSIVGMTYGLTGVALGVTASVIVMYFWMGQLTVQISGCSWGAFLRAQAPGWLLGVGVGAGAMVVRLTLEAWGLPSAVIVAGIAFACAALLPLGVYLLPRDARPDDLFIRLGQAAAGLPAFVRNGVLRVLRVPG